MQPMQCPSGPRDLRPRARRPGLRWLTTLAALAALALGAPLASVQAQPEFSVAGQSVSETTNDRMEVSQIAPVSGYPTIGRRFDTHANEAATPGFWPAYAYSSSVAAVGYGHMRLSSNSSAVVTDSSGSVSSQSSSSAAGFINDSFVINCALCTAGTTGQLTVMFSITGALSADSSLFAGPSSSGTLSSSASWFSALTLSGTGGGSTNTFVGWETLTHNNGVTETAAVKEGRGYHTLSINFVFGEAIDLSWFSQVSSSANAAPNAGSVLYGGTSASSDFTNSFVWEGITQVVNSSGQAITGFTALNSEGVSYARSFFLDEPTLPPAPVPEPATWGLMALGLVGLALGRQMRRRHALGV